MHPKILLFIPTYNCEAQIPRVLAQLKLCHLKRFQEIVIYDNGSSDQTKEMALKYIDDHGLPVKFIVNERNVNLGGTHKIAFQKSIEEKFDYCLILHGDDQADIKDFDGLFESGTYFGWDYVFGSRFSFKSKRVNYSVLRTVGNIFFNAVASVMKRKIIPDLGGSGLNLFKVSSLEQIGMDRIRTYDNDLTFHVYLLLDSLLHGQKVLFYPITWREYDQKTNVRLFRQTIKLFKILFSSLRWNIKA
jgi:glycosyltransferase involved in cell wall biosynthesis